MTDLEEYVSGIKRVYEEFLINHSGDESYYTECSIIRTFMGILENIERKIEDGK